LRGPEVETWLQYLDLDQANFRAVMQRGLSQENNPVDELTEDAASTAGSLWFYWYQRGLFTEGRGWLERAVEANVSPLAIASNSLGLANLERVQNNPEQGKSHCLIALDLFRAAEDEEGIADALSQLGALCQYLDQTDEAEGYLSEAVEILRRIGSRGRLSFTLVLLGALKQLRDDLSGAQQHYSEGLEIGRELDDKNYIATGLVNLGEVLQLQGDSTRAAEHFSESLEIFHTLGVRNAVAYCLEMLAGIDAEQRRGREATILFGAADKLRELLGSPVEAFNQERYQRDLLRCRESLSESQYQQAWDEGRDMPLAEVVEAAQDDHQRSAS
jgi:non-specific serine/threonine protein kinase